MGTLKDLHISMSGLCPICGDLLLSSPLPVTEPLLENIRKA
jgi:hypothetical protein